MRSDTVKQSALRREQRPDDAVVDLTAHEHEHDDAAASPYPTAFARSTASTPRK